MKLACKIPDNVIVACSGGPDSMALLDFCLGSRKRKVSALFIDHGTEFSKQGFDLVSTFCNDRGVEFLSGKITGNSECEWSENRNSVFNRMTEPVITGHNLEDAVEWWIITSMRGNSKLMPVSNMNVSRPLLLTEKSELVSWCECRNIPYLVDPTNIGEYNTRAKLRKLAHSLYDDVFPGLKSTIRNKYVELLKFDFNIADVLSGK